MRNLTFDNISSGLTSVVIIILGLMVGLYAGTNSKLAVIAGVLTYVAVDAFLNIFGIFIFRNNENKQVYHEVRLTAFATFLTKFLFAFLFVIPALFLSLQVVVISGVVFGLFLLSMLSCSVAKQHGKKPSLMVVKYVVMAVLMIVIANYFGVLINKYFA